MKLVVRGTSSAYEAVENRRNVLRRENEHLLRKYYGSGGADVIHQNLNTYHMAELDLLDKLYKPFLCTAIKN